MQKLYYIGGQSEDALSLLSDHSSTPICFNN